MKQFLSDWGAIILGFVGAVLGVVNTIRPWLEGRRRLRVDVAQLAVGLVLRANGQQQRAEVFEVRVTNEGKQPARVLHCLMQQLGKHDSFRVAPQTEAGEAVKGSAELVPFGGRTLFRVDAQQLRYYFGREALVVARVHLTHGKPVASIPFRLDLVAPEGARGEVQEWKG